MIGTLLNTAAVLVGATVGSVAGDRLPEEVRATALHAIGLVTLLIGMQMALQVQDLLVLLASVVIGGAVGEAIGIERGLSWIGSSVERRFGNPAPAGAPTTSAEQPRSGAILQGFVTASLIFCVGPLTILGALQDGLTGDFRLLAVKSVLDGLTSIVLASTLGRGVYLAAVVVLVYQGMLSLAGHAVGLAIQDPAHNPALISATAAGGVLILGLGVRLLEIKPIRVGSLLPAIAIAPLLTVAIGPSLERFMSTR